MRRLEANHTEPLELPKGPSHPCCNSRRSPAYPSRLERKHESPAHIQRSPVSASLLEMRDPFPAWSGKNSRRSRRISSGGALHRKCERNSRVVPPFPESPRCLSPFQGNRFSCTASTFKPRIDSHNCDTWDIPVGKPRGKATAPLIQAKGSVTLLLKLGRKANVHVPTRNEDLLP